MTETRKIDLPESVGAMLLPGGTLFPGAMLPLYIFEPRYRLMLSRALESHRVFAVAPAVEGQEGGKPVGLGGAGIIRACVANADGTSNLILQGLSRVRFVKWSDAEPYPSAAIEAVPSFIGDPAACKSLRKECLALTGELSGGSENVLSPQILDLLGQCTEPASFSDLAASCAVHSPPVRVRLIEEPDVAKRLEILAAYFTHLLARRGN